MSRNFELLQKAEQEREAERRASAGAPVKGPSTSGVQEAPLAQEPQQLLWDLHESCRDQISKLVQRLFLGSSAVRNVVFAGGERRAGCTWVVVRAAQILARQNRGSVCLVDANLRSPELHKVFNLSNHNGFSDAVLSSTPLNNYVQSLPTAGMWLLSCGSPEKTDRAQLSPEALRTRIWQLRAEFDYVLVDAPALNLYPDAMTLGSASDGIVLVLKANSSRRESAQKILQEAKAANVCLLGVVLNQRTFPIPASIYSWL